MGWRFPFRFGARDRTREVEHRALLDALRDAFDVDSGTEIYAETHADALAIELIWRIVRRVGKQNDPRKMLENLPKWERACTLRPSALDADITRRQRLAAKLRGLSGNSLSDQEAAAAEALGNLFEAMVLVDPDDLITYWPGLNPGPPGYEWTSSRAVVGFKFTETALTANELEVILGWAMQILADLVPSWQTFVFGSGDGFICSEGLIGITVLA